MSNDNSGSETVEVIRNYHNENCDCEACDDETINVPLLVESDVYEHQQDSDYE
jgi:hypothetical protein